MTTKQAAVAMTLLTLAVFLYTWAVYPALPERIPTHWNWRGEIDGWSSKGWMVFFLPGMMAIFLVMLYALPWLSPRNFSVESFRGTFNYVLFLGLAFMGYLCILTLQAALHPGWNVSRLLFAGMFFFFALIGNVLGKVRRNFWVGIRTPWTLASDAVWTATHRFAARLLAAAGLVSGIAALLGAPLGACFLLVIAALLLPVVYSLLYYKRLEQQGRV